MLPREYEQPESQCFAIQNEIPFISLEQNRKKRLISTEKNYRILGVKIM